MKELANGDCQLAHGSGSIITGGTFVITSTPDTKTKSFTKGIYFEKINFTFSGGNSSGYDSNSITGSGSVNATATKCKRMSDSKNAVRKDDENVTGPFQGTKLGIPSSLPDQPVKVSNAGQTKHLGN